MSEHLGIRRPLLHQVWIGPAMVPERLRDCIRSWRAFNPDVRMALWTDDPWSISPETARLYDEVRSFDAAGLVNADLYAAVERWTGPRAAVAARSDIVRMEVIAQHGGIYADMDVRCFRGIEPLLHGVRLMVADEHGPCNGNYLFGAVANHPAMWTAVRELRHSFMSYSRPPRPRWWARTICRLRRARRGALERWNRPRPVEVNPVLLCGPRYLNAKLQRHPECVVLPSQLFNPLHASLDPDRVTSWPPAAYGNHEYIGMWYDRRKKVPPPEYRR